jgi:hypothetical protein
MQQSVGNEVQGQPRGVPSRRQPFWREALIFVIVAIFAMAVAGSIVFAGLRLQRPDGGLLKEIHGLPGIAESRCLNQEPERL